jgi:hypothetical protein
MVLNFPISWLAKRLPYEIVIQCFITRHKGGIPIKLRNSKEMLTEVKSTCKALIINLKNLREITIKRRHRTMRLPLQ